MKENTKSIVLGIIGAVLMSLAIQYFRASAFEEGMRAGSAIQSQQCVDTVLHYSEVTKPKMSASF